MSDDDEIPEDASLEEDVGAIETRPSEHGRFFDQILAAKGMSKRQQVMTRTASLSTVRGVFWHR
jgi:hypothetical protein